MTVFSAYIPMDRRLAIASGHDLPDRVNGSVLFADISGFTTLAELLEREWGAQRGAEELTNQLNLIYGALIREVHQFRGSVIGFSGDAITCWIDGDDGRLGLACAIRMQQVMSQFEAVKTSHGTSELAIKIVVVAGPARRFLIGLEPIQRIDALAGDLLDRSADAEKYVDKGEIIVGPEVVDAVNGRLTIAEWRANPTNDAYAIVTDLHMQVDTNPWPNPPEITADLTKPWLLPPVYERLQSGQDRFITELRPAVSLFLKFSGINYDQDEEAGAKLSAFVEWVQTVLSRYEGYLLQLTIGDKGSYIYAIFGAPIAHEDDPRRAVATARILKNASARFPFLDGIWMGISQGHIRAGGYGSETRRTYGALGTTANLAARLMGKAENGQILVTERIASVTRQEYQFDPLPPLKLKGLADPVQPLAVSESQREVTPTKKTDGELVGREKELNQFQKLLEELVQEGQSSCLILEGEAGIGKSRLLADFIERGTSVEAQCLVGYGEAMERLTPYFAWRSVFQQLFDEAEGKALVEMVEPRLTAINPNFGRMLPLLNGILPLELTDNELTAQMSGEVRSANIQEMLMLLLADALAAGPMLLILEDTHWFDSASWSLLQLVQREVRPLLLILANRPFSEQLSPAHQQIRDAVDTQLLTLNSLPLPAIEALLKQRLGVNQLPTAVSRLIHEKAEGNPFFSEELAHAMLDAGLLKIEGERASLSEAAENLAAFDFPDTIQGVIISRLDRLDPSQQVVLKVASIIGRFFAFALLHDIYPVDNDRSQLGTYLNVLADTGITPMEAMEPELIYSFKHIIFQEVAYSMMTFSQRKRLHQATAEWFESVMDDEQQVNISLLAYHWLQAVDGQSDEPELVARAVNVIERAGDEAVRNNALREAMRFFSEAVRLDSQIHDLSTTYPKRTKSATAVHVRRARWHRVLGMMNNSFGNLQEAIMHLDESARLLGAEFPTTRMQWARSAIRELGRQIYHRQLSNRAFTEQSTAAKTKLLEVAQTYGNRGAIYAVTNDFPQALYMLLAGFNRSERAGPSQHLALALADMGNVSGALPLHKLALRYVNLAEETTSKLNESRTTAIISSRICVHLITIGEWERAEVALNHSLQLSETLEDRYVWEEAANIYNALNFFQGHLQTCITLGAKVSASARYRGDTLFELWGLVSQAEGYVRKGEFEQALKIAEEILAIFRALDLEDPGNRICTHSVMSVASMMLGNETEAELHLQQAVDWLRRHPDPLTGRVAAPSLTAEACVTFLQMNAQAAPTIWQETEWVCRLLNKRHQAYRLLPIPAKLFQGIYAYLIKRNSKASKLLQQCLTLTERFPMRYEAGLAHFYLARVNDEQGLLEKRDSHAEKAQMIFTEIGSAHLLGQLHSLGWEGFEGLM